MRKGVADYSAMRSRIDDHETRALGCWGLVARWPDSRKVVESLLGSDRLDDVEDAAGILCRVGVPSNLVAQILAAIESLPDSSARDALVEALPARHPRRAPDSKPIREALKPLAHAPLHGTWEPYTSHISFIESRFDAAVKQFSKWQGKIRPPASLAQHRGELAQHLALLDPYWFPLKTLLVETRSNWTAVFGNPHSLGAAHVLSKAMRLRSVETSFSVDVVVGGRVRNYGNCEFHLIDRGESVRTIQVSRQSSGWEVYLLGTQQAYEEPEHYQARIKRDRFDIELLNKYCFALGIDRANPEFYGPRAALHVQGATVGMTHSHYATAAAWRLACLGTA